MTEQLSTTLDHTTATEVGKLMAGLDEAVMADPNRHWYVSRSSHRGWEVRIHVGDDGRFAVLNDSDSDAAVQVTRHGAARASTESAYLYPPFRAVKVQADSLRQVLIDAVAFWLKNVGVESATPRLRLVASA